MARLFLTNSRLLALTLLIIIVAGLGALSTIAQQEDPEIVNRFATVVTPFPGAGAERVEALVTQKIEDELRELPEIQEISSTSRAGISVISIELDERLTDVEPAFALVRDGLADAERAFPDGAGTPVFDDDRLAFTLLIGLIWDEPGMPVSYPVLARYAEELETRLRNHWGVQIVRLFGAPGEEVRVRVDEAALTGLGLSLGAVADAVARADSKVAAGVLSGATSEFLVEVAGELDSLGRLGAVPVLEGPDGAVTRLRDVATLERGIADPPGSLALVDGRPAVTVAVRMEPDRFQVQQWSASIRDVIAEFAGAAPHGVDVEIRFDQSGYTEQRLGSLVNSLLLGISVVVAVLFLTLGWRAALIVTVSLPLISLMSVFTLKALGVPIHQMSVTGLIVALGLMVDSAIVIVNAIRTRLGRGVTMAAAVADTIRLLWVPLLASTVTTILAFMPLILMPGAAGEFVGAIGLSVTVALISSYALAMTVVPALSGRLLPREPERPRGWFGGFLAGGLSIPPLTRLFRASIRLSLRWPRLSLVAATVPPVLGFVGMTTLTEEFFPPADRDQFHIEVFLPSETAIGGTRAVVDRMHRAITARPEVTSVDWYMGESAPAFYYNLIRDQDGNAGFAQALVTATSLEEAQRVMPILQADLDRRFPQAQVLVQELLQGPPVSAPVELRIVGPDLDTLRLLGEQARRLLSEVPTVTHTQASLSGGEPKLVLQADEDRAQAVGLRLVDVARQLNANLDGTVGGSILEATEELPVRIRADGEARTTVDGLASLMLDGGGQGGRQGGGQEAAASGEALSVGDAGGHGGVPLSVLGTLTLEPALQGIPRRNGERVNTISGFIETGTLPDAALGPFQALLEAQPLDLPPGYRLEFGGDAEERDNAVGNLLSSVGVLVVLMLAAVVLTFSSFRLAGLIFVVAAQAMGLGLLSLTLAGWPFGFTAIIGLLGLVGVAINAAIIISSSLQDDPLAVAGDRERITEIVVADTSRHIVSTTITTAGGFLPLILSGGEFWPPFATVIAGGVLLSAILSFYFVPAAFLLITRARPVRRIRPDAADAWAGPDSGAVPSAPVRGDRPATGAPVGAVS